MPTYVYQVITDDDTEGEVFEVFQKMSDDALTEHPETGVPVKRIPTAPNIAGKWSELRADGGAMSNKNLDKLGFTKYEKAGDGHYEKKAGAGPNVIHPD
ncbi:MAG: FmdB family transcriptional regulator [Planctomycetota bacterium]|nr:FmdB family transcriptional regulator [Planctomycetota bacterium]